MLAEMVILLVILLIASVIHQKFEKRKDRNIKEELRETLEFTEQKYEASMEFNTYFLNNYGGASSIIIGLNSKHYILYNEAGQAVIKESKKGFSDSEKIFYGARGSESGVNIN